MLFEIVKRIVALLPLAMQRQLKQFQCFLQIRKGTFRSPEPEFDILESFVKPGDWVIDVGANVGHYTRRFSELVGQKGHVISFEPVPETFAMLAANLKSLQFQNVTLINVAASTLTQVVAMVTPMSVSGLRNLQESHLVLGAESGNNGFNVLACNLDSFNFPRVNLVKIDAEGHEFSVLSGMLQTLRRDRPTLIVETGTKEVVDLLTTLGYTCDSIPGSPNKIFRGVVNPN